MTQPGRIVSAVASGLALYFVGVLLTTAIAWFLVSPVAYLAGFVQGWFGHSPDIWIPPLTPFWTAITACGWIMAAFAALKLSASRVSRVEVRFSVWLLIALIACSQLLRIAWPFYVWPGVKIFRIAHQNSWRTAWLIALTALPNHRWLATACLTLLPFLGLYVISARSRRLERVVPSHGA
jgi:hypothetical protein